MGRLVIRGGILIDGTGTPARGPVDIVVEGGRITAIVGADPVSVARGGGERPSGDRTIDAAGLYVLPGFIDMHAHIPSGRGQRPFSPDYAYKLWLAHGVTTLRDAGTGAGLEILSEHRRRSLANEIVAPRIYPYVRWRGANMSIDEARARVRELKAQGAAGIKLGGVYPDLLEAIADEADKNDLPIAQHNSHTQRGNATALDAARAGVTSIEHWYGVPETAILDRQNFPNDYNQSDELARFRYAGRLWREVDPELMQQALEELAAEGIAWDPTFSVYEANRDLSRARHLPWHARYTLPALYGFWEPSEENHGSYHHEWTSEDEAAWSQNFRIWMDSLRAFAKVGGKVITGSDAGSIYNLYGFGYIRELELLQEAGFRPLQVIRAATSTSAEVLGEEDLGQVRVGFLADLIVVNGNPVKDLKVLFGDFGSGGIRYTIKGGAVFDAARLLREVGEMVTQARRRATTEGEQRQDSKGK